MDDDALEALRREAEMEMRRKAPRELDGTDLRAKRRKTFDAQDGATGGEADESLERYEYAAPDAIVRGLGCVGFVVTCSFQREKSATREATEMLRPRLPTTKGLRLNPVKMPGRGFILVRMSERPDPDPSDAKGRDDPHPGDPNDDDRTRAIVAAEAVGVVTRTVADVKAGRCPAPRFVEKIAPVTATCAFDRAAVDAGAVAALAASGFDARGRDVSFAVSYHNRFKTQGDPREGGAGDGGGGGGGAPAAERHGRREVIEAVAGGVRAALTAAGATGVSVDLGDPDVVAFAEVISVLAPATDKPGSGAGKGERFTRRLALGLVPKSSNAFERRKKGITPASLKTG